MVTAHKITADFYEDQYTLIALHSTLDDYALAYTLNAACGLQLKRLEQDLEGDQNLSFSTFEWKDSVNEVYWILIANRCVVQEAIATEGFFAGQPVFNTHYLTREKKVDYFLKADTLDQAILKPQLKMLHTLSKITAAYPVATPLLKLTKNLIF